MQTGWRGAPLMGLMGTPRRWGFLAIAGACFMALCWQGCGSRTGLYLHEINDASEDGTILDGTAADGSQEAHAGVDGEGGVDAEPDVTPAGCGFATCPKSCCVPDGGCYQGPADVDAGWVCGGYGEPCEVCPKEDICKGATCYYPTGGPCNSANCDGCCFGDSDEYCASGRHDNACGHGGEPCLRCNPAQASGHCELLDGGGGVCSDAGPPCGPETCAGCCTTDGVCAVGTQPFACGSGGQGCTNCVFFGMQCVTGACQK